MHDRDSIRGTGAGTFDNLQFASFNCPAIGLGKVPGNCSKTGLEYLLLVLRRCVGRNLPAGNHNAVAVQAAIHHPDWQIVLQLEPAQPGTFVGNSRQFKKPANDRDDIGLFDTQGRHNKVLSTQVCNLGAGQTLRQELNPGALQKRHYRVHKWHKLQFVARYLYSPSDPGDCITGQKLPLIDLRVFASRLAAGPGPVFDITLLMDRSLNITGILPVGSNNTRLGEWRQLGVVGHKLGKQLDACAIAFNGQVLVPRQQIAVMQRL